MAKKAPMKERTKAQAETSRLLAGKQKEHDRLGKAPFEYDPYGPGVMPEEIWQKHKKGGELSNG